jgi:hypothetical protein
VPRLHIFRSGIAEADDEFHGDAWEEGTEARGTKA